MIDVKSKFFQIATNQQQHQQQQKHQQQQQQQQKTKKTKQTKKTKITRLVLNLRGRSSISSNFTFLFQSFSILYSLVYSKGMEKGILNDQCSLYSPCFAHNI